MLRTAAGVACAVALDRRFQASVVGRLHVGVRGAAVNHGASPVCRDHLSIHLHACETYRVEPSRVQADLLHRACE